MIAVLDTEGVDIHSHISRAAARYGVPKVGLLAMLKAESGLNRRAERWGTWPDLSFGYSQITVATAAGHGIGDGSNTPTNIAYVRHRMLYRSTSINTGAAHLSGCYGQANKYDYASLGLSHDLAALTIYNAGHLPPKGDPWWKRWEGNIANYKVALEWAKNIFIS